MLPTSMILLLLLLDWSSADVEYVCRNNITAAGDLQITLVVNQYFGSSCDTPAPSSSVNPISNNIIEWSKKVLPADLNLGLQIIDVCGDVEIATKAITELVPWSGIPASDQLDICTVNSTAPATSIGVVSAVQPVNYDITNLLSEAKLPLIVAQDGYHDGPLPDQSSTFYLGHSMDVTIEMMGQFMVSIEWDFLTVVYSDDTIGMESYKAFENMTPKYHLCIDKAIAVDSQLTIPSIDTKGVVYLGSQSIGLQLLTQNDLNNKIWVTSLDVEGLTLGSNGKVYSVIRSGGDVLIDSLAVLGQAIAETYNSRSSCSPGSLQQCVDEVFREKLIENTKRLVMLNQTYSIDNTGTVSAADLPDDVVYAAYDATANEQVASISLQNGVTPLKESIEDPSLCDPGSMDCVGKCGHLNNEYMYIHGDWIVVVAVQVHTEIDPDDHWKCKDFTQTSLFYAEVARFTFDYLRKAYELPNDKTMGMLVIDSCGDKLKTAGLVYDIVRGYKNTEFCDRMNNCLNHSSIVAVIGDFSSAVTQKMQTVLKDIPIPHVSYGASTVALSDRDEFPYFLRTNPPDNVQAHFMIKLLKKIDERDSNEVNAVNIMYTDGLYGKTAAKKVLDSLNEDGLCVHLQLAVNETRANNFTRLVNTLLEENDGVRFIIAFLDPEHLTSFMDVISSEKYSHNWLSKGFSFVLSDTWNDNKEYLLKYGQVVQGSFTFKFNADFQSTTFNRFLARRPLSSAADVNPWMSTLEQLVGGCKLRGNFMSQHSNLCQNATNLSNLTGESYSLHLMKALTAVFLGIKRMADHNTKSIERYLFDPATIDQRYETLMDISIPSQLEGEVNNIQPFTEETDDSTTYGNGRVGYTISNIRLTPNDKKLEHIQILQTSYDTAMPLEDFETGIEFQLNGDYAESITSVKDDCSQSTTDSTTTPVETMDQYQIAIIIIGCIVGLIAVIFTAFLIMRHLKKKQAKKAAAAAAAAAAAKANDMASDHPDSGHYVDVTTYPEFISHEQEVGVRRYLGNGRQDGHSNSSQSMGLQERTYNVPRSPVAVGADNPAFKFSLVETPIASSDSASQVSGSGSNTTKSSQPPVPAPRVNTTDHVTGTVRSHHSSMNSSQPIAEEYML